MKKSIVKNDVLPFLGLFAVLILATMAGDFALHQLKLVWVGRYLGIPGTILILLSLLYSLRKRKVISFGNPKTLLGWHEVMTWLGAWMVMIHAGVHFNAILPWLATGGMIVNVVSGLTGRYLLERSRRRLAVFEEKYRLHGMSKSEVEKELFWEAVTFETMGNWRAIHFPISIVFAVLALGHILSVFLFWEWK
ncbi:MAG: hypothetical protein HQL43_02335 [Alphaproteobacteria bacterium]|nr:hypothetical protein [Alphaproteobacteria bacterium]